MCVAASLSGSQTFLVTRDRLKPILGCRFVLGQTCAQRDASHACAGHTTSDSPCARIELVMVKQPQAMPPAPMDPREPAPPEDAPDIVEEASLESFPPTDPPACNP